MLAALLAIAVAGVGALRLYSELSPEHVERLGLDTDCDLRRGACARDLPEGGHLSFAIEPPDIPVMRPIELQLELRGVQPGSVAVEFQGVDMNMGYNRARLEPVGGGHYRGKAILPVCVRERMSWEALLVIDLDGGPVGVPFRFDTVRPGSTLPSGPET